MNQVELEVIQAVVDKCTEYLALNRDRTEPVVRFKTPEQLKELIDFTLPEEGTGLKGMLKDVESTLQYSVRTGHVRFYNQLWAGFNLPAILGEWLLAVMNTSMYTYEVSPVFSIMEVEVLKKLRCMIGWQGGDGVFAPGGANCNLLALLAARNRAVPNLRKEGISKPMVCFSSIHDHYTIQRAAGVLGIGEMNCVKIPVDDKGHMLVAELEKAILKAQGEGKLPFFVNATAGTTVLGAYDPLQEIATICKKYNLWGHVDACWGGHCLFSRKHRHLMDGCQLFDSIAWTATKCLGLPQQCAALLTKEQGILAKCNAMGKDYLFHEHEQKEWDLGEKTLNCGRRVDALKLWLAWKVAGDKGMEEVVDHAFDQAQFITQEINNRSQSFKLVRGNPESLNVCFWYVPPSVRSKSDSPEKEGVLDQAVIEIRQRMQKEGKLLTNYSDLPGVNGHFFRHITCNPGANKEDMTFVLDEIERLGADL